MVNKSGRTGRDGEHKAITYLTEAGFQNVVREGKRAASLDLVGEDLPYPVEVKRRRTLAIPEWTRLVSNEHGRIWAMFVLQRDARRRVHPDMMIMPADMGARALWALADKDYYGIE